MSTMVVKIQMGKRLTDTIKDEVLVLNTGELARIRSLSRHLLARSGEQIDRGAPFWPLQSSFITDPPPSGALFIVTINAKDAGFSGLLKI